MWPVWWAITAAARSRQREEQDTDGEHVREAIEGAAERADAASAESTPARATDHGVACIGQADRSVIAPMADITLHELANATVASVDGEEWIKSDRTVDVLEVR